MQFYLYFIESMTTELTKDIWNNFIAIPFNKNKSHNFSVKDLKTIIEKHLGKEEVKKQFKPFKVGEVYQTKGQVSEPFKIAEIKTKIKEGKTVPYYFNGFYLNREHLGICPINAEQLIQKIR